MTGYEQISLICQNYFWPWVFVHNVKPELFDSLLTIK